MKGDTDERAIKMGYQARGISWSNHTQPWYPSTDLYSTGNFLWVGVAAALIWYFYKHRR